MTTHLHTQIHQLKHCNNSQPREAITEGINRHNKVKWIPELSFSMTMCCRSRLLVIRGSPFLFPFNRLPQASLDSLWNTCENSSKGRRCGPKNPTTFPLEEHAPLQDASAAELQRAASHPSCLPCWALCTAVLQTLTHGKAQGKYRRAHVFQEPFSSFRNSHEAASYCDLLL